MRTLYRKGDREEVWGVKFDYAEFDDSQVESALADGWVENPLELKEPKQVEQVEQVEQASVADTDGNGKLSLDEAKAYLAANGVGYEEGLHWKKVVALAEQHMNGE